MRKELFMLMTCACTAASAQIQYPDTHRDTTVVDTYFGQRVMDPYRWLEDDNSAQTKDWVQRQNKVTEAYLDQIPFRDEVKERLTQMWNYPKNGAPFKRGDYYYVYKNDGLQNQPVLYRMKTPGGAAEVFLDPNKLSAAGTTSINTPVFSKSGTYAAYLQAQAGSDWQEAFVLRVKDKELMGDHLEFIKFSNIAWNGDEGFYYSRYPKPNEETRLTNANENHQVFYHRLGTPQSTDVLVFEDKEFPLRIMDVSLTHDNRFLSVIKSEGTSGSELWVKDLSKKDSKFIKVIPGFSSEVSVIENDGDRLLVLTNLEAPNYRIVSIDPSNPAKENWREIVPEKKSLLQSAETAGGKMFLTYLKDASSEVYQVAFNGKTEAQIELPAIGTASGFDAAKNVDELFYTFTSFNYPPSVFRYNLRTHKSELFDKSAAKFEADDYQTDQVFFTSKDGTRVPMFITHKKGLKKDGKNPVLMYGYGGFNIPLTPGFSISNAFFLEQGGVYVVVSLRGGKEYGEDWHKQGMLQNKQNVFDDFISAAEFLIAQGYTNPKQLAIRGGSNGGLLVGAAMTQRPDLFAVAIPQVGVLDMLRYHLFTIGWAWATEYGRSDRREDFETLYAYSPLHNLKPGVEYPATLITTADHDDRVVPAHSFKFAAQLQHAHAGDNPVLIRIETDAGHGAGKPTSKLIEEAADIWSFVMYHLGMKLK